MWEIFLKTLPFFALIGLGYGSGRSKFFTPEATAYLTKFVFYFALSAMLFRFSANLSLEAILDWQFVLAYLSATTVIYVFATVVALRRGVPVTEAALEAQCAVIGNVGFLGIPMLYYNYVYFYNSQYHQQLVQSVSIQTGRQKLHKVQKSVFHPIYAPKSSSAK